MIPLKVLCNLNSEICSVNNSVEGNFECNVENDFTTENIDNSSVNICSEASVTDGNSVQVDKNVGVAVSTSFSSLSGPAGLSSSRVPAEVAVFQDRPRLGRFVQGKVRRQVLALWRVWRRSGSILGRRPSLVDQKNQ